MSQVPPRDVARVVDSLSGKDALRFIVCGSVDDGKSTLIGRLLCEDKSIFDDQWRSPENDSSQCGSQGSSGDAALLHAGLQVEREQGITTDVAYRSFATDRRCYIVGDTPGRGQYACNMAAGASTADLAVILVDARKGVLTQTLRDSRIVAMMGVHHVVLAVNKIDLVGFSGQVFVEIAKVYREFADSLGFLTMQAIPVSALDGDNLLHASQRTPWYVGPCLMAHLDALDLAPRDRLGAFRMPVQWVSRANPDFPVVCGRIAGGVVRAGDAVRVLPSGVLTRVKTVIADFDGVDHHASAGDSVSLVLADEVDAGRGDVLAATDAPPETADQFEVRLLWVSEHAMAPGRQYLMKLAYREVPATVTAIKYREDLNSGAHLAAKVLAMNEIAIVNLSAAAPVVFEPYGVNRTLGTFVLIDRLTFEAVGAGRIDFALRRASNIHWQALELNKAVRAAQKHQRPRCVWFTGLSGSGKSTIANLLEKRLHAEGRHTYLLDGDNVRHGLNRDLGFTEADRVENIRRVAEVAKLMVDAGLIVLVSFISPFRAERHMARELFVDGEFVEVFVDTPLAECERRDVKGLYAKARRGELKNFTGIDSPYEAPEAPEIRLPAAEMMADECVSCLVEQLT
jgi:bifunctional enzyme CysN/CysC